MSRKIDFLTFNLLTFYYFFLRKEHFMAYIAFVSNGYWDLDNGYNCLFFADNTHSYLFDYVTMDLSRLSELLEQYIDKKMDITSCEFELKEYNNSDEEITAIQEILTAAHPYYKHHFKEVIMDAIGTYFNQLLAYSIYACKKNLHSQTVLEDWYIKRIKHLVPSSIANNYPSNMHPLDFYNKYEKLVGQKKDNIDEIEESFIDSRLLKMPTGFSNELQTQKTISNMLYLILDIFAPELERLTLPQRAWIYSQISQMAYSESEYCISQQYSFSSPPMFRDEDRSQDAEKAIEIRNIFQPLYSLNDINIGRDGIPANMRKLLSPAVELAKAKTETEIYKKYQIDSLQKLLFLEIMVMIQDGTMIRKCKRCGKYFVVNNRKIAYCDRVDEAGLRCSAVGSQQNFQKKLETDEPLKIYNRAYKTHFARVKKGTMNEEDLQLWRAEAKSKLMKVRAGEMDIASFQAWLKN